MMRIVETHTLNEVDIHGIGHYPDYCKRETETFHLETG